MSSGPAAFDFVAGRAHLGSFSSSQLHPLSESGALFPNRFPDASYLSPTDCSPRKSRSLMSRLKTCLLAILAIAVVVTFASSAQASTVKVCPSHFPAVGAISAAVGTAASGTTIELCPGIYLDNVVVNQAKVKIIGEGKSGAVKFFCLNHSDPNGKGFDLEANDDYVQNMKIANCLGACLLTEHGWEGWRDPGQYFRNQRILESKQVKRRRPLFKPTHSSTTVSRYLTMARRAATSAPTLSSEDVA